MQRKTKIICILLVLSIITCLCNTAWAESNASYDGRYYQDTDLGETLEILNEDQKIMGDQVYVERVFRVVDSEEKPDTNERIERYFYSLNDISKELDSGTGNTRSTGSETVSLLSYSITLYTSYSYTIVPGTYATYYRLNSLYYSILNMESNITLLNAYIEIANNGIGEDILPKNQQNFSNRGSATSGTIYGNSSWTPAYSLDSYSYPTATRFYVQLDVQRGTGYYSPSWKRAF